MLSPEVLASHQATLELQARDEDRLAPPSEARPGALTAARTSTRNPRPVLRFDDEDF